MVLIELFKNLRICNLVARNYCTTLHQSTPAEAKELGVQFKKWIRPPLEAPREVWIESLAKPEETKIGLLQLHPEIFATMPRIDIVHQNVIWQQKYRHVSYSSTQVWHEIKGGNKKPWPQKGLGRSRHGTIRSALFRGGEIIHGPRPYKNRFYMLPYFSRIMGLTSTLSIKLAQDDLHIVDSLDIPSTESSFITDLIEQRNWGPSVLIVDDSDIIPQNIAIATDSIQHVNLLPVYGLNVFSMLKHDTLVLTTAAVERIEEKILEKLYTANYSKYQKKYRINQQ